MIDGSLVKPAELAIPEGLTREQEVVAKRRVNGKTFDLGGGQFKTSTRMVLFTMRRTGRWRRLTSPLQRRMVRK